MSCCQLLCTCCFFCQQNFPFQQSKINSSHFWSTVRSLFVFSFYLYWAGLKKKKPLKQTLLQTYLKESVSSWHHCSVSILFGVMNSDSLESLAAGWLSRIVTQIAPKDAEAQDILLWSCSWHFRYFIDGNLWMTSGKIPYYISLLHTQSSPISFEMSLAPYDWSELHSLAPAMSWFCFMWS